MAHSLACGSLFTLAHCFISATPKLPCSSELSSELNHSPERNLARMLYMHVDQYDIKLRAQVFSQVTPAPQPRT
ncbi:hypothetical protein OE88DRAFT_1664925 [Heliocybe sulcata]|uniref:Secreted protein n=1 Tax=Heliocybe sulcata TaxID=5364 RepID=A0A5C3N2G4_9AGAM|nr:hypothetical protein OE88DRAFT_1664925 [Heliocybe sulcata]